MRCVYEPEWDHAGVVQGWIALISDITHQQQAEESKVMLSAIVQSSQDVIISKSLEGRILTWNSAAEQLFGYSAAEMVGQSINRIVPPDLLSQEAEILARLTQGERIEHFETVRVSRSGRRIDVSLSISPLCDSTGRVVGASKIARDVTARKRGEAAARFLADASAALAELTDQSTALERIADLAVPAFADWCAVDLRTAEGVVMRLAVRHVDPAKIEFLRELERRYPANSDDEGVRKVLASGQSEWVPEITDEMLTGAARSPEQLELLRQLGLRSYLCVPMKYRGRVLGALTFATSETDRIYDAQDRQLAEDLAYRAAVAIENANLVAALRESDRRKDLFLATLGHELRNPLAPISNALQVLRLSHTLDADATELCEVMSRQTSHLVRLVDDLLEVSRISRGKIELRREPVDVWSVVMGALEMARPLIEDAGHRLEVHPPPQAITVDADQVRLSQVVGNLLTNAAKYMDAGGTITLTARSERGEAVVSVRDTGLGIPPEMLSRVFEMFTQMPHTRERQQGGLGIGLALARTLIEMQGGRLDADSAGLGQGSEFVLRLPQIAATPIVATAVLRPGLPRRKVLVVDDTRAALFVIDKLLTALGQDVRTCATAVAALASALEDTPDVVISDIGMPEVDGYELARRFRSEPTLKGVVLVALTGYGLVSDRQRAQAAGFDQHLVKPVGLDDLQSLLLGLAPQNLPA